MHHNNAEWQFSPIGLLMRGLLPREVMSQGMTHYGHNKYISRLLLECEYFI